MRHALAPVCALAVLAGLAGMAGLGCAGPLPGTPAAAASREREHGAEDREAFEPLDLELTWLAPSSSPPFPAEGPAIVGCGPGGVIVEQDTVEVRTAYCDPADLEMELPVDVPRGAVLGLTITHDVLIADGGEAHLAVLIDDDVVWENHTPLPAAAAYLHDDVTLDRRFAAGARLRLHVHNHGSNTYTLHGLTLR